MGMTVKHSGPKIPTRVWDKKSSESFAKASLKQLKSRAFGKSLDVNDRKFTNKKDGSSSDLVESGRLRDSVTVTNVSETSFELGSNVEYAPYVDAKRTFMGLSDGDMKALQDNFEKSVEEAMNRSSKT